MQDSNERFCHLKLSTMAQITLATNIPVLSFTACVQPGRGRASPLSVPTSAPTGHLQSAQQMAGLFWKGGRAKIGTSAMWHHKVPDEKEKRSPTSVKYRRRLGGVPPSQIYNHLTDIWAQRRDFFWWDFCTLTSGRDWYHPDYLTDNWRLSPQWLFFFLPEDSRWSNVRIIDINSVYVTLIIKKS